MNKWSAYLASVSLLAIVAFSIHDASAQIISGQSAASASNITQWNGNTIATNNGATSAGTLRVTISNDSTGQVTLAAGANTIGAVTQASGPWTNNVTQFGGTNVSTGTGAGGTGIPRVTVSNDSTLGLVAGAAIIGKVGIDQTTAVTTNGVVIAPVSGSAAGITPVVSAAAEGSHVFKASAGNSYSIYATTGATAGFVMIFNATSAPADGAVTPIDCVQAPANTTVSLSNGSGPPDVFSTGITGVFSTTGCFTKTISATAFFKGRVV